MNLKVNYNEINNIGKFVSQKDSELKAKFDEVLALFTSVSDSWKGADSQNFVSKSTTFVNNQIQERERLARLGQVISKVSQMYSEKDVEWESQMKKVGLKNEL